MRDPELLLTGGAVLNVFTGELERRDVAVRGGRIAASAGADARHLDLAGRFLLPGFIEGHIHLESTMLSPAHFAHAAVAHGTTSVVADPHEIANVAGLDGIRALAEQVPPELLTLYLMAPSCVPATPLETAGAALGVEQVAEMLRWPNVLGLGEMMNYPGVVAGDPAVMAKLQLARGRVIDGHAPGLTGEALEAYIAAGPDSDHEATSLDEGLEKLRRGMWLMIREGSASRNLHDLAPLLQGPARHRCLLVSDDLDPQHLLEHGHLDRILRLVVSEGIEPVDAVRAVTLNPAQRFGLRHVGAVAPGHAADLVAVDDLVNFSVSLVVRGGRVVYEEGEIRGESSGAPGNTAGGTVHLPALSAESLRIPAPGEEALARVIVILPQQLLTDEAHVRLTVRDGAVQADPMQNVLKLAVIERHGKSGTIGLGFVRGFGLSQGALASTVAHDSHNLLVVGADDESMLTAARAVLRLGGGQVVAAGTEVLAELPLDFGGLMSMLPPAEVVGRTLQLNSAAGRLGCALPHPFMALSFLALPVIPRLKLTDLGLVDVTQFDFVPLLV